MPNPQKLLAVLGVGCLTPLNIIGIQRDIAPEDPFLLMVGGTAYGPVVGVLIVTTLKKELGDAQ